MCKATKDFTIITDNGSKKESFDIKKAKQSNMVDIINKKFNDSMNNCKLVCMKKNQIVITM